MTWALQTPARITTQRRRVADWGTWQSTLKGNEPLNRCKKPPGDRLSPPPLLSRLNWRERERGKRRVEPEEYRRTKTHQLKPYGIWMRGLRRLNPICQKVQLYTLCTCPRPNRPSGLGVDLLGRHYWTQMVHLPVSSSHILQVELGESIVRLPMAC